MFSVQLWTKWRVVTRVSGWWHWYTGFSSDYCSGSWLIPIPALILTLGAGVGIGLEPGAGPGLEPEQHCHASETLVLRYLNWKTKILTHSAKQNGITLIVTLPLGKLGQKCPWFTSPTAMRHYRKAEQQIRAQDVTKPHKTQICWTG